jgi:hypothetical protein
VFSLVAPFAAALLGLLVTQLRSSVSATGADWPGIIIAASGVLIFSGVIAAILALVVTRRAGYKGVFGLALAGLVLNVFVATVVGLPVVSSVNKIKKEKRLSLVAGNAYLQKVQQVSNEYSTHTKALRDAQVLDMKGVEQKEQLEPRKNLVRQFLAANDQLKDLLAHGENLYQQELQRVDLPQSVRDAQLLKYRQGAGANEQAIKIREADGRIGQSLLGALNLLDDNWGKWKYDPLQKRVIFSEPQTDKNFQQLLAQFDGAAKEVAQLQDQLVSAPRRQP